MKRTLAQHEFDDAKHGWAFASGHQLSLRIQRCEKIAARLDPSDERYQTLEHMRQTLTGEKK
jgi:hypothetical protein